jgi:hypothetical protein
VGSDEEQPLSGGRVTPGVVRVGDTVRRPTGPHSAFVHQLLKHLEAVRFDAAPRLLGQDEQGREVLSFLPGEVPADLGLITDQQLADAFRLLRRFHDATAGSSLAGAAEIVCHGDISPCNTVLQDGTPVALIDFDAAAPGRRIDDLAYGLFLWLDLGNEDIALDDQRRRLHLAAAAYGVLVDSALVAEVARQIAITTQRLRDERRESAAWWAGMYRWVLDHAVALAPGDGPSY